MKLRDPMVNCFKIVKNNLQIKSSSQGRIQEFTWDFVNLHFVNLTFGQFTFGQFKFRQLTFRHFTFRQLTFRQFTLSQFTFRQFTFRQLTFRQFTFGQLTFRKFTFRQPYIWSILHLVNCYQMLTDTFHPTAFGQLKQKLKNLVNFDLQGVCILHIFRYRKWNNCNNCNIKVQIKLTDESRHNSLVSSETKHEIFACR